MDTVTWFFLRAPLHSESAFPFPPQSISLPRSSSRRVFRVGLLVIFNFARRARWNSGTGTYKWLRDVKFASRSYLSPRRKLFDIRRAVRGSNSHRSKDTLYLRRVIHQIKICIRNCWIASKTVNSYGCAEGRWVRNSEVPLCIFPSGERQKDREWEREKGKGGEEGRRRGRKSAGKETEANNLWRVRSALNLLGWVFPPPWVSYDFLLRLITPRAALARRRSLFALRGNVLLRRWLFSRGAFHCIAVARFKWHAIAFAACTTVRE